MGDEIRVVELLCERFGDCDSLPLSLLQWFTSRLGAPIRLGPIRAGDRTVIVTKVQGEYSVSEMRASEPKSKKEKGKGTGKMREVDILLVPETSLLVSFASYRFVLCLDVSKSVFDLTDAGLPFAVLVDSLLSFLSQLVAISPPHVAHIYVSVLATTGCEGDAVLNIWTGDLMCNETDVQQLLRLVQDRLAAAQDEIFQEHFPASRQQLHSLFPSSAPTDTSVPFSRDASFGNLSVVTASSNSVFGSNNNLVAAVTSTGSNSSSCSSSAFATAKHGTSGPTTTAPAPPSGPRFPDLKHFTRAMGAQLEALPRSAFPVAVLFTSGNMKIQIDAVHTVLPDAPVTLHVVVEAISPARPVGFYSDVVGLEVVAEELHGGQLSLVESRRPSDVLASISALCNSDLFFWQMVGGARSHAFYSDRLSFTERFSDPSNSCETPLQAYGLEGATAEHLLCLRLHEGFSIINVSQENCASGEHSGDHPHGRFARISMPRQVTVCLKKALTKLSSLVYELTFTPRCRAAKATSFGIRKLQTAQKMRLEAQAEAEAAKAGKKSFLDRERMAVEEFSWTNGPMSIDVRKIGPSAKQDEALARRIARTAQAIREADQSVAAALGEAFMPGCIITPARARSPSKVAKATQRQHSLSLDWTAHGDQKPRKRGGASKIVSQSAEKSYHERPPSFGQDCDPNKRHTRPSARKLAAHTETLERLFSFDRVLSLHFFGPALGPEAPPGPGGRPASALQQGLVKALVDTLPYPNIHQLGPGKWLVVVSNCSDAMVASDSFPQDEVEMGLVQLEVSLVAGLFSSVKIFSLGPCAHAMVNLTNALAASVSAVFLRGTRSMRLSSDFQHLVISGRGRLSSSLRSTRAFASLPPQTSRKLRALLVSELVSAKQALGFLLASTDEEAAAPASDAGPPGSNETISLQMCCICASHPGGIFPEALVQCRIECSPRALSVEYSWPKGCNETKDEAREIVLHEAAEAANRRVEAFIFQLAAQDENIFSLYSVALPLASDARSEAPKTQLRRRSSKLGKMGVSFDQAAVHVLGKELFAQHSFELIAFVDWAKMTSHAKTDILHLPCLSSPSGKNSPLSDGDENDALCSEEDYRAVNKVLRELLCKALLRAPAGPVTKKTSGSGAPDLRLAYIAPRLSSEPEVSAQESASAMPCLYAFVGDALILLEIESPEFSNESTCTSGPDDLADGSINWEFDRENSAGPAMRSFPLKVHYLPLPAGSFAGEALLEAARDAVLALPPPAPAPARSTELLSNETDDARAKKTKPRFSMADFKTKLVSSHLSNFTRVLFYAARNGVRVQAGDVRFALEQCGQTVVEVDIAAMCRRHAWGENQETAPPPPSVVSLLPDASSPPGSASGSLLLLQSAFLTTIGTKISSLPGGEVFVMAAPRPDTASQPGALKSSALPSPTLPLQSFLQDLSQSLADCACLFASFFLSHRGFDEGSPLTTRPVPSSAAGVAEAIVSTGRGARRADELVRSDVWLGMRLRIFPAGPGAVPASMASPAEEHLESISSKRKLLTQSLSQELRAFVATDTLSSLLQQPEASVTAETLAEVQRCLRDVPRVKSLVVSLDFVAPSAAAVNRQRDSDKDNKAGGASQQDLVAAYFEREMRGQAASAGAMRRVGETMFARSWAVSDGPAAFSPAIGQAPQPLTLNSSRAASPAPDTAEADGVETGLRHIPCWVLLSISNSNSPATAANAPTAHSQTTTLKIGVSIRKTEGDAASIAAEHDKIARSVEETLCRCCFRINQIILLRELHESKIANPLLVPLHGSSSSSPSLSPVATPASTSVDNKKLPAAPPSSAGLRPGLPPSGPLGRAPSLAPASAFSSASNPVLGSSRQRAVTSLINLIPPRTSIRSKLVAAEAPAPAPQHATFACPRQGVIACSIHSGAAVQYDMAVRYLEKAALNQFAVENHDRYFVSEDGQGNVHYMRFDRDAANEPGREGGVVRLSVFGLQPMEKNMSDHLQVLLNHRLMEITAKTISPVLARTSTLYASYGNFLRHNGTSRPVRHRLLLPAFVSDVYFFLCLARQVMTNSQVLSRVSAPSQRHTAKAELLHPSLEGYSLQRADEEPSPPRPDPLSPLSPLEHSTSAAALLGIGKVHIEERPVLVRSGGVVPTRGADKIHPAFFGRSNRHRSKRPTPSGPREVVWQQGDFTLLYNVMAPLPPSSAPHLKAVSKLAGLGLALVEMCPSLPELGDGSAHAYFTPQSQVLETGAVGALAEDVAALQELLRAQARIAVTVVASGEEGATAASGPSVSLCVYPSIPMHTAALVDVCVACFNQALLLYVCERLFSACGSSAAAPEVFGYAERSERARSPASGLEAPPLQRSGSSLSPVPPAVPLPSISQLVEGKGRRGVLERGASGDKIAPSDVVPLSRKTASASVPISLAAAQLQHIPRSDFSLLPCSRFDDFLRLFHSCMARHQPSPLVPPFCGCAHVPCRLPKRRAQLVHRRIVCAVLEAYPHLRPTLASAACEPLFDDGPPEASFTRSAARKDSILLPGPAAAPPGEARVLRWFCDSYADEAAEADAEVLEGGYGITVCVLGEQLRDPALAAGEASSLAWDAADAAAEAGGEVPAALDEAAPAAETRFVADADGASGAHLPHWLRRRRCVLEISVSADGVFVLYANVLPKVVADVVDIAGTCCSAALARQREVDEGYLVGLQAHLDPQADTWPALGAGASLEEEEAGLSGVEVSLLRQCLARLSWERRVMNRLYLNRHARPRTPSHALPLSAHAAEADRSRCLQALPREAWRRGVVLETFRLPLFACPAGPADAFVAYVDRLRGAAAAFSCDVVGPGSSYCYRRASSDRGVFLVLPVPLTSTVIASEVQLEAGGASARITHRAIAVTEILWAPRAAPGGVGKFSIGCFGEADSHAAGAWAGWQQEEERARDKAARQRLLMLRELGQDSGAALRFGAEEEREERGEGEGEGEGGDDELRAGTVHPVCLQFMQIFRAQAFSLLLSSLKPRTLSISFAAPAVAASAESRPASAASRGPLLALLHALLAVVPQVRFIHEARLDLSGEEEEEKGEEEEGEEGVEEVEEGACSFGDLVALARGRFCSGLTLLQRAEPSGQGGPGEAALVLRFECAGAGRARALCQGKHDVEEDDDDDDDDEEEEEEEGETDVEGGGEASAAEAVSRVAGLCFVHAPEGRGVRVLICGYDKCEQALVEEAEGGGGGAGGLCGRAARLVVVPSEQGSLLGAVRVAARRSVSGLLADVRAARRLRKRWSRLQRGAGRASRVLADTARALCAPLPQEAWAGLRVPRALLHSSLEQLAETQRYFWALVASLRRVLAGRASMQVWACVQGGRDGPRHILVADCSKRRCALHLRLSCAGGRLRLDGGPSQQRSRDGEDEAEEGEAEGEGEGAARFRACPPSDDASEADGAEGLAFLRCTLDALGRACEECFQVV